MPHAGAAAVIAAVAGSAGDLGIFRPRPDGIGGAWWTALAGEARPKIIARLPFIERPDHPAGTPVFVVSKPLADAAVRETVLVAARLERWREAAKRSLNDIGAEMIGSAGTEGGLSLLTAMPGSVGLDDLRAVLAQAGVGPISLDEVGSHADRFHVEASGRIAERPSGSAH